MLPSSLIRERDNIVDLCWLLAALGVTGLIAAGPNPTATHIIAVLVVASLTSRRGTPEVHSGAWRKWLSRLPWQGSVAGVSAALFLWWAHLPWIWLLPLATWPFLTLISRSDWFVFTDWIQSQLKYRSYLHRGVKIGSDAFEPAMEALILGCGMHLGSSFWSLWAPWPAACLVGGIWFAGRLIRTAPGSGWTYPQALIEPALWLGLVLTAGWFMTPGGIQRAHFGLGLGLAAVIALLRWHLCSIEKQGVSRRTELARIACVAGLSLWVMRGFATPTMHGTPDALWYGTMLHDMVLQTRAGIFPVFLGQTEYQFNGAIYPLRVAPAFHHLGALLDCLTLRTLVTFALQNLLITVIGTCAALACYFCCCSLSRGRRWWAALLAVLFISCPGVVGMAYYTDLFMSWTTLPWVVIAFGSAARSFAQPVRSTFLVLGGATGLLWWGHAPIALWSTIALASLQVLRLVTGGREKFAWMPMACAAGVFLLIAAYPLGSVLLYPPEAGVDAAGFQRATPGNITRLISETFPASVLPLSIGGRSLGDFQLGYALIALWAGGVVWRWRDGSAAARGLLAWAGLFLLLLWPWPVLNLAAWQAVPGFVRDTTGNWAMNRLYLLCATCVVTASALLFSEFRLPSDRKTPRIRWLALAVVLATGWSLLEARKFALGSAMALRTADQSAAMLAPENAVVTRFAYLVFPKLPSHFSHGVMDPQLLHRLLSPDMKSVAIDNQQAARTTAQPVAATRLFGVAGDIVYEPTETLSLVPGQHYLAEFSFALPRVEPVVLQVFGPSLHREYALPEYGEGRSFGQGGEHTNLLPVFTTSEQPEAVRFRLVCTNGRTSSGGVLGATVQLLRYEPRQLPVYVTSWAPYRSTVRTPEPGWLETPRMYQTGYTATVNGVKAAVKKSPDGLVAIAIPPGESRVELGWRAPAGLLALFWTSLLSIAGWLGWAVRQVVRDRTASPASPGP